MDACACTPPRPRGRGTGISARGRPTRPTSPPTARPAFLPGPGRCGAGSPRGPTPSGYAGDGAAGRRAHPGLGRWPPRRRPPAPTSPPPLPPAADHGSCSPGTRTSSRPPHVWRHSLVAPPAGLRQVPGRTAAPPHSAPSGPEAQRRPERSPSPRPRPQAEPPPSGPAPCRPGVARLRRAGAFGEGWILAGLRRAGPAGQGNPSCTKESEKIRPRAYLIAMDYERRIKKNETLNKLKSTLFRKNCISDTTKHHRGSNLVKC